MHLELTRVRITRKMRWTMNTIRELPWRWTSWELNSPTFSNNFDEFAIAMMNIFIKTLFPQYYDNNGDIYDDGVKLNELLLVSRLIYSILSRANHMKVEAHMSHPVPLTSLSTSRPILNLCNIKLSNTMT